MKLPIFPLPVFLLPQGITRLRIFEQRYLKMVKLAIKEHGFAILSTVSGEHKGVENWASWVDIINFDQDKHGVLTIDVKCKSIVSVSELSEDKYKLKYADIVPQNHWPEERYDDVTNRLSQSLLKIFEENNLLSDLYQSGFNDNANWIMSRWVELLPITLEEKMIFAQQNSYPMAKQFIANIVLVEK
ncbi:LON peptidase substrate-binding domain-containing protein [Thalassotalea sp. PP2-459]|uniref:LON peptidase substrate-binding domain-containing protein n=1 Tax=Thalassotalea sp. PP2-459 TaxID=1742724 RepID=UPI000943BA9F|nr:LON peptidase substrate-binding domain-containing protein [Thalassotalea sp. PP2-459]OKY27906.1 hypothetical protein BI291_06770 [Thalassotalea sp. PP2-459]